MKMFLNLTLFALFSTAANATPIFDRYYIPIPEDEAHYVLGRSSESELNPNSIKTFVWNIKKTQEPAWENEFRTYGEGQDLFLLQEAYQSPLFMRVIESFQGMRWDMGASFLYRIYGNTATGTLLGSRVRPSEVIVKHTADEEPVIGTPKAMTFAKYPISNTHLELLAVSVHGINLTSFASFKRHMEQAVDEISKHDGPVLFAGDFNTRTKGRTRYLMGLIKSLNMQEVKFKHAERRMAWKFTKNYLDHGFVRGLEVLNAQVLKDSRGSDHKPMMLELALQEGL